MSKFLQRKSTFVLWICVIFQTIMDVFICGQSMCKETKIKNRDFIIKSRGLCVCKNPIPKYEKVEIHDVVRCIVREFRQKMSKCNLQSISISMT